LTAGENEINGAAVDVFTVGHAAVGAAYGTLGLSLGVTTALALLWELAERPLKRAHAEKFPHPSQDTAPNAISDVIAVLVGRAVATELAG